MILLMISCWMEMMLLLLLSYSMMTEVNALSSITSNPVTADIQAWKKSYSSCQEELDPTVLDLSNSGVQIPKDFPVGT